MLTGPKPFLTVFHGQVVSAEPPFHPGFLQDVLPLNRESIKISPLACHGRHGPWPHQFGHQRLSPQPPGLKNAAKILKIYLLMT